MDARAADALAIAVGHSLPSGLVEATAEIERLRARVAELEKDNADLKKATDEHTKKLASENDLALRMYEKSQRFEAEADCWRHKYTQARLRPNRRARRPYVRPSER